MANRRDFIKNSVVGAGAIITGATIGNASLDIIQEAPKAEPHWFTKLHDRFATAMAKSKERDINKKYWIGDVLFNGLIFLGSSKSIPKFILPLSRVTWSRKYADPRSLFEGIKNNGLLFPDADNLIIMHSNIPWDNDVDEDYFNGDVASAILGPRVHLYIGYHPHYGGHGAIINMDRNAEPGGIARSFTYDLNISNIEELEKLDPERMYGDDEFGNSEYKDRRPYYDLRKSGMKHWEIMEVLYGKK